MFMVSIHPLLFSTQKIVSQKYFRFSAYDNTSSPIRMAGTILGINGSSSCKPEMFLKLMQIILAVGMKLQAIISTMANEIRERHTVVQGIPLVHLSDQHFWFGHPRYVLFLLHLALFQVRDVFLS
ncbi:hypothetical protein BHE74_00014273 [Ensete ventricosum]|nr:hypothetical protein BHE74_00014273 [Ensete ventricosum]